MTESNDAAIYAFGEAEVDPPQRAVRFRGKPVDLDRSAFEVLVCLLQSSGGVVNKLELLKIGWPGRVVTENSLSKAIARLRSALDDSEGACVESVHGYGYRIALPIRRRGNAMPESALATDAMPMPTTTLAAAAKPRFFGFAFAGTATLGALAVVVVLLTTGGIAQGDKQDSARTQVTSGRAAQAIEEVSVAVLPFKNLSPDSGQEFFSEGLGLQLTDDLSHLPQLRVIGQSALARFLEGPVDVQQIGREFAAANVLSGSVQRSEARVRVTMQLTNAGTGELVWSNIYDRPHAELFAMQDEIARSVIAALRVELLPAQTPLVARRSTSSPEAYGEYLLGLKLFKDDETGGRRALAAYERAVAIDPEFTDAWIRIADLLGHSGFYADNAVEALEGKKRAMDILERLLARHPDESRFWLMRGAFRYAHWWDWSGAEQDFQQAAKLGATNEQMYLLEMSRIRAAVGDLSDAIGFVARATEVEPKTPGWSQKGYQHLGLGQYDEARASITQAILNDRLDEHAHYYLGLCNLLQGDAASALANFDDSAHVLRLTGRAAALFSKGDMSEANEDLNGLIARYGHVAAFRVAQVYAWRGESNPAFEWLEKSVSQHEAALMYLKFDPLLRSLRNDPRFNVLLAKVNLPTTPLQ